ncbi:amidohydrolase family protein [Pseudodesulfovibrio piezophilus]|uniref:Amidohydrolase-related domain-containing protein n=1 Tax=Pseudodesulfovibrio piezophilus (strain DSM 21447 / JCM 15486 / C1TLV30) TaxID=1322246 RepID=M1WRY1_PSEP2|nr:amidohydrolase family protein [Pseudodesulfovibrio piezophilus]CCH48597.1 conserved protein of unknown function [Pseudodesulfovibrio piezophilus C1TLV30]
MNIFDFNIHFTNKENCKNPHVESDETRMQPSDLMMCYDSFREDLCAHTSGANFMLFNQSLFFDKDLRTFFHKVREDLPASHFSALIDFRHEDAEGAVDNAAMQGVRSLKFHSYFQRISEVDFEAALRVAKRAESLDMFVCVDTSYGTSGMYAFDNLKLACLLADELSCPILLLHSGGLRALEAMLLAEEKQNVFLETSFSLAYYAGSRVQDDLEFAYKKLGPEKLIYGSDYPYVDFSSSLEVLTNLAKACRFSDAEIEKVAWENSIKLFS